jgi:uncharacterized protein YjbI with pentapeptide repeats
MLGFKRREFIGAWRPQTPRSTTRRQGLRKLSPDLISKARDETATQVTRIGLTFVGTAAFCLLSLLSPDSALLSDIERINVPFAGPVSSYGFMIIGPLVLIVLRVYLQIYVEHSSRLDRLAQSVSVVRPPTLVPLENSWIRLFSGLVFYALLPAIMLCFAWKAAVLPKSALFTVVTTLAIGVIAYHEMLLSWRPKGLLTAGVAIIVGGIIFGFLSPRRFNLYRANLSDHSLAYMDLRKADLRFANLSGATLGFAELYDANLAHANLSGATLTFAKLHRADLGSATLSGAVLFRAELIGADLTHANLSNANLLGANLSGARLGIDIPSDSTVVDPRSGVVEDLGGANLSKAKLRFADLSGADLTHANLSGADLSNANLSNVKNLTQAQLDEACGNANTKLPKELTLKPCV